MLRFPLGGCRPVTAPNLITVQVADLDVGQLPNREHGPLEAANAFSTGLAPLHSVLFVSGKAFISKYIARKMMK